jgi:hypothetical protein
MNVPGSTSWRNPSTSNFEIAVEADERLLAPVMHVKRGLIALARIESPIS